MKKEIENGDMVKVSKFIGWGVWSLVGEAKVVAQTENSFKLEF